MSCCAEHHVLSSAPAFILQSWSTSPYLTTLLLGPPLLLLLLFYPALILLTPKKTELPRDAYFFTTAADLSTPQSLPKLVEDLKEETDKDVQLSVVIPAYDEESRLPKMLKEAVTYLESLVQGGKAITGAEASASKANGHAHPISTTKEALLSPLKIYEVVIVDDGSRDSTVEKAMSFAKEHKQVQIRIVRMGKNCGKGAAVRHGVLHTRGQIILFVDADGATRFSDLSALATEMNRIMTAAGHGIVCGSRAHLVGSEAVVKRSFIRNLLMHSFHLILSLLLRPPNPFAILSRLSGSPSGTRRSLPNQPPIRDTQCGFKLFTRPSAKATFPLSHIDRWIFDVELLLLAEMASSRTLTETGASNNTWSPSADGKIDTLKQLPLPIAEVAVDWREVEGSKIDLLADSIGMAKDLLVIRLNYALGRWKKPSRVDVNTAGSCCTK